MNKFTRKIAGIFTAAAVAFGSIGALPDTGILPGLSVTASALSPYEHQGSGTAEDPWQIETAQQWRDFAEGMVSINNSTYGDDYYKLTADITVEANDTSQILVGSSARPFRGHFDGGGHTLTFNYSGMASGAAPFKYVSGATIENLKVTGTVTISAGKTFAAGIAGYVTGDTTINSCTSSVTIHSSGSSGSGLFGGLVGEVSSGVTLNINNCVFNGSMTGSVTMACGGFVGYNLGTVNITDCLSAPVSIGIGNNNVYSFVGDRSNGISSLTRAYRTCNSSYWERNQGIRVYTEAPVTPLTKKVICAADNNTYYAEGGASVSGATTIYKEQSGTANISYTVKFDGTTLTKGTDYTETITNSSSQTVSNPVNAAGTYTLTVTGKGDYAGSLSQTVVVFDKTSTPYLDASGAVKTAEITPITNSSASLSAGWYAVTSDVTISDRINISGDVHIILCDGKTLNAQKGIGVTGNNSLTVYAQSTGDNMGALIASGPDDCAGIGGDYLGSSRTAYGNITINGGTVTATTAYQNGAGIGGAGAEESKTITINGGNISAAGGHGIGGGSSYGDAQTGGTIVLNWNSKDTKISVNAKFGENTGYRGYCGTVTYNKHFVLQGTSTEPTSVNLNTNDTKYKNSTLVPAAAVSIGSVTGGAASGDGLHGIGETVDLTLTPKTGYTLATLTVTKTGDSGTTVTLTGENSFIMPAYDVTVSATFVLDPSHLSVNDAGTEYTIHDSTGWDAFCKLLKAEESGFFTGKTVKLDDDISVTTMAGTSSKKFSGTFDGQGHTISITYNSTDMYTAPFSYVDGCTIKKLHVSGTITTSKKYAAGFIAMPVGVVNIINCRSSVVIKSSGTDSKSLTRTAGFVSTFIDTNANITIEGCVFDGKLVNVQYSEQSGGFVGYKGNNATLSIANSLYIPAALDTNENEVTSDSCTFARNWTMPDNANCYYTRTLGTAQGKATHTITVGDNVTVGLSGTATEYDVSGITVYADNSGLKYGDTIYAGEDDTVSLTLSNTPPSGKTFSSYTASAGTLTGTENPYTLTMPAGDVTVSAEFEGGSLETVVTPTFTPAAGSYIGTQSVEISCETDGATIYYTTNGSTPTTSSTEYTAAIAVSTSKTIKAIAVKSGMTDSAVASAEYTITPAAYTLTVTAPTFDAVTAGYAQPDAQAITITSTGNSNATISSVALSGTNAGSFTLTNGTASVTAGGTNSSYTIRPNAGLAVGTYTATITVTYDGNETATADVSFTVNEATPTTYTVTYKVVNGTWADDTTADKTETVTSGANPSNVPTGMKASSGYTGGAWDTDPTTVTITGATTFTYTFTAVPTYTVTVNSGTGGGSYAAGASVTITAGAAPSGQQFKEWTGADGLTFTSGSATTSTATFTMPASAVEVTATYEDIPATSYTVTVNNGTGGGNYFVGSSVTIVANAPENGKRFKEWTGADGLTFTEGSASTAEATFTMPAKAVTVMATYENLEAVATPTFSPAGGTFTSAQSVTISCATSGATIYYTTDGTTPTTSSSVYSSAIAVSTTTTIKAIAVKAGMTTSSVASATYTINTPATVATPTFSPAGGTYTSAQSVTISCATSGATIYYTTNGTTPTTSSSIYSSAVAISATTTIKAIAVKAGMTTSLVASATYTINTPATVATPTFSPAGGTYTSAQNVTISCATSGATIYYTTNGTTPTTSSSIYSSAIAISATTTIKAIAVKAGMTTSSVASATYTINTPATVATPTFSPAGGTYTSAQSVTISCSTSGATIYYTTNGSTPTTSSLVYNSAIAVSTTTTIKAIAVKAGMTTSAVASATYTITDATVAVTSVTLNKTTADVEVGKTITLTATVLPANATDPTVTWTTNKAGVATVVNGVVTGVSAGTAKITATAGGKSASCTVTVKDNAIAVTEITLNKSSITLTVGDSETLIATVTPDNATYKTVTWTTSDRNVAVVLNGTVGSGTVSATGVGTATITAKAGDKTATCTVTVKPSGGGGYTPVTPSYPSGGDNNTGTTNNNTNTNEPKIEGGSGASGWNNITNEINKTPEGGSVTVDMAGTTTVPAAILDAVKGKDVDVVLDMGDGVKWTINGKDVDSVSGSIDLGVTVGKSEIPADVINNMTGEKYNVEIHLNYSGDFGFKATLTIDMRKQDAGLYANLYYYNPTTKALEFVSSGKIKDDGTVDLEFSHASDYTIVVDDHDLGKELTATVSRTGNVKLSWTAQDGAESYNVYQAIDGKWVKLGTTSKTAYTVKSLTNNKTYKFMVRAKVNGKLVAKADAMTLKVKVYYKPAPKATTADGRITLSWKGVPYATKYRIYVVKNGKYVKLKDTKKLKYSTSATVGKTYKFAVKAYINGKWTSVKASDIIKIKAK